MITSTRWLISRWLPQLLASDTCRGCSLKLSFQPYLELGGTPRLPGASRFRAPVLPPL
jgi:hypothetical protein